MNLLNLEAYMSVNSARAKSDLSSFEGQVRSSAGRMQGALNGIRIGSLRGISSGLNNVASSASSTAGALLSLGGALGTVALIKSIDAWETLQKRISSITGDVATASSLFEKLVTVASQTGSEVEASVETFQRLSYSRKELQATDEQMLKLVSTVQKLGALSGASAMAMKAGLMQFGQAMSSGTVRAEEMNSILENIPAVANQIASSMGMSMGELRKRMLAGKLTSKEVFDTLLKGADDVDARFAKFGLPISGKVENFKTKFLTWAGSIDKTTGSLDKLGSVIDTLGDHMTATVIGFGAMGIAGSTQIGRIIAMFTRFTGVAKEARSAVTSVLVDAGIGSRDRVGDLWDNKHARSIPLRNKIIDGIIEGNRRRNFYGPELRYQSAGNRAYTRMSGAMSRGQRYNSLADKLQTPLGLIGDAGARGMVGSLGKLQQSMNKIRSIKIADAFKWMGGAKSGIWAVGKAALLAGTEMLIMGAQFAIIGVGVVAVGALFQSLFNLIKSGGQNADNFFNNWIDNTFPKLGDAIDSFFDKWGQTIKHILFPFTIFLDAWNAAFNTPKVAKLSSVDEQNKQAKDAGIVRTPEQIAKLRALEAKGKALPIEAPETGINTRRATTRAQMEADKANAGADLQAFNARGGEASADTGAGSFDFGPVLQLLQQGNQIQADIRKSIQAWGNGRALAPAR